MSGRRHVWLTVPITVMLVWGAGHGTLASFVDESASVSTFTADVLAPPTGLTATGATGGIRLRWTATADAYASGYAVLRSGSSGTGFTEVGTVSPAATITTLDAPPVGTWWYALRSRFETWASVASAEASATRPATPGPVGCTAGSNAPASGGVGDGYETTPGNACAPGGGAAIDANTGTLLRSSACANTANDRHVYWGYDFGPLGSTITVDGIVIEATLSMTGVGTDDALCIELSGNAGETWSAPSRIVLPDNTLRTYTFGSPDDRWGHTWSASELGTTTFRIRVTDASGTPLRSYQLDHLAVLLYLTP